MNLINLTRNRLRSDSCLAYEEAHEKGLSGINFNKTCEANSNQIKYENGMKKQILKNPKEIMETSQSFY